VHSPPLQMQVCGFLGDAVQATQVSVALRAGVHRVTIAMNPGVENEPNGPVLYWEGPQTPLEPIPASAWVQAPQQ
jgi:hypothetical protein